MAALLGIRRVEITAAAFCDLDNRLVVLPENLCHKVVNAAWVYLKPGIGKRPFRGHFCMKLRVVIAAPGAAAVQLCLGPELRPSSSSAGLYG